MSIPPCALLPRPSRRGAGPHSAPRGRYSQGAKRGFVKDRSDGYRQANPGSARCRHRFGSRLPRV
ncbi:MAG: hypothetical protein BJ554DRAFT_6542 [Olpidium bornovanus]|uniref:Uncharacterized protein n=1 Tax=Olpidium bornovanus TaxID=278681 RepID=A0A8H8A255_9FUNG|nr:MAG: hypothetical protein BJ554DRAFT_6542 [Olpidium bornovanus]